MDLQTNRRASGGRVGAHIDLVALLDGWAGAGHGTLPRRLAHALRRSIQAGVLPTGWRLPAERLLAADLAVSRATVSEALDELRSEGLLTSTQGRGTFVAVPGAMSPLGTRVADHLTGGRGIDLASGNPPDLSHLPAVSVDMSLLNASGGGPGVFALGLPAMRAAIAELYSSGRMTAAPRFTEPDEINVTAGAHQAIALLVSTLVGRGGGLALAAQEYPGIFDILDGCEARPLPVRTDRAGMLPEALEQVLATERPGAVYMQTGPHNPTGTVLPPSRARALAETFDRHDVPVIEDITLAPLAFRDGGSDAMTYFHDVCRTATVASVGSLSKVCWAGLRLGWIKAPQPLIDQTMYRGLARDLGPSVPSQLLALGLLPHLDTIAAERRRRLAEVVAISLDHLAVAIPEAIVAPPGGGSVLWAEFPVADSEPLVHLARRHGVQVAPGSISVAGRIPGPYVRICVDRPPDLAREGLDRLARAWRDYRATAAIPVAG